MLAPTYVDVGCYGTWWLWNLWTLCLHTLPCSIATATSLAAAQHSVKSMTVFQVLVEDFHDSWTLTQCTAKELQQAYGVPLQRAGDLLHTLQQNPELHPVPRYAQRNVSRLVSRAIVKFLEVRHLRFSTCCAPAPKICGHGVAS